MSNTRKPRIYHPFPLIIGEMIELESSAAQHITQVLRMRVDEALLLFNNNNNKMEDNNTGDNKTGGTGEYLGIIKSIGKKTEVYISEYINTNIESPLHIHLGQSIVRGDRMDFIMQKATELGVSDITPLISTRGMVKLEKKSLDKKMQHWQNIIISATQQCGRTRLPVLHNPQTFQSYVRTSFEGNNMLFEPTAKQSVHTLQLHTNKKIRVLLGPESGFTDNELQLAHDNQFASYTLGPRILRAETASLSALAVLQALYGDL